jgi:hypothetical protein
MFITISEIAEGMEEGVKTGQRVRILGESILRRLGFKGRNLSPQT